jgi:cytochrome c biogenesis protein ResB
VSSGTAFFSRIWKRKLTLVSAGMIVFHLSFVTLLGGIVYNRLFFFQGILRLTEGETLPNGDPQSYDFVNHGRFFDFARLRGATTLVRLHRDYQVDGGNKRSAYEIAVGDEVPRRRSIIYVTEYLDHDGVRYFCLKEGYSLLVVLAEKGGKEIFGAHVPLQSYKQEDKTFRYASGTSKEETPFAFPPPPNDPRAGVHISFRPSAVKDREGEITFRVAPLGPDREPLPFHDGRVVVGAPFEAGGLSFTVPEVRYWVGIDVRRDPGLTLILGSLCGGMAGMAMIFAGRVRQGGARRRAATTSQSTPATAAAAAREEIA